MLITSPRHRPEDLELWAELEAADMVHGQWLLRSGKIEQSMAAITDFAKQPCYASVSWGKDSVVLAHMIADMDIPTVWIKQLPLFNPDCELVRDAFLRSYPLRYDEITVRLRKGIRTWHATGSIEAGFAEAAVRHGRRYLSGIRAAESGGRKVRMRSHGLTTRNTCAPLGWWTEADVFGYLAVQNLPVHPVYAMLGGGRWDRQHIRTCRLDGRAGDGIGRAEWEREYYGDVIRRMEANARS